MNANISVRLKIRLFFIFSVCFLFACCSGKKVCGEVNPEFQILRFDKDLYGYLVNNDSAGFIEAYKPFLDEFGKNVIYVGGVDSIGFDDRLKKYFSEPTLMGLYADEQKKFSDLTAINAELSQGLETLIRYFPTLKQPKIYMHVSGLNQNVIVTDDFLSLSADKYLGADYPLYSDFFYEYQQQLMSPDRIVPDYLLGFIMANFPFQGNEDVLLDRILYEGKLRYILSLLIPDRQTWEYVGYNEQQYSWCKENEAGIWKFLLENKHLFTPDYLTTNQYLKVSPHTAFLPAESPGRVGEWLGFQIINAYMKHNPDTSLPELIAKVDYQELLKLSKYKP
jgi:hypothetical protein